MRLSTAISSAAVLALLLATAPAFAQSTTFFTVDNVADDGNAQDAAPGDGTCADANDRCTLRAAVTEANATSGRVVINLPGELAAGQSGNYTIGRPAPNDPDNTYENANEYGDLDVGTDSFAFDSLTLRGTGTPGPSISGTGNDRLLDILGGTVTVERIAFTGGASRDGRNGSDPDVDGNDAEDGADGGAIRIAEGASATLRQLAVTGNSAGDGGNGAAPATGPAPGGNGGDGGNGAGIANFGTLSLARSFIASNTGGDGGSGANGTSGDGSPVAGGDGGSGGNGAGIYSEGPLTVQESTVFGNSAGNPSGGAAGTNGGEDGAEGEGGSGAGVASLFGGTATFRNTIVAENTAGDDVQNGKQPGSDLYAGSTMEMNVGTVTSGGFNLIGTNDSVADAFPAGEPNANDDLVGTGQQDDPGRIAPLIAGQNQNESEAIPNLPLSMGSPAIDAGANTDLMGDDIAFDGRGFVRPGTRDGDMTVDIGAYEYESRPAADSLVINELDAITGDPDDREFVEIKNIGSAPVQLADYALVFYDGSSSGEDAAYRSLNLEGELAPSAVYTVGNPDVMNVELTFGGSESDVIDSEGAVAIYRGNASDYPNGAEAGQNEDTRADVLVYDNTGNRGGGGDGLCGAFGQSEDCAVSGDDADNSIQRNEDGSYTASTPTPGEDTGTPTAADDPVAAGEAFRLTPPYPNPATSGATLRLDVRDAQPMTVAVYDVLGQRVAVLLDEAALSGSHAIEVPTERLAPGVYFVRVRGDAFEATQPLTVVR